MVSTSNFDMIKKLKPEAIKRAGFLYLNIGGSPALAKSYSETAEKVGFGVEMLAGIDTAEFNYGPYVQQLKEKGITFVYFVGGTQQAVRLAETMAQQSYKPDVFYVSQTQYNDDFVKQGGGTVDGVTIPIAHVPFTQASNKEMALYLSWLRQVKPSAQPTSFGRLRLVGRSALRGEGHRSSAASSAGRAWSGDQGRAEVDRQRPAHRDGRRREGHLQVLAPGAAQRRLLEADQPGDYNCGTLVPHLSGQLSAVQARKRGGNLSLAADPAATSGRQPGQSARAAGPGGAAGTIHSRKPHPNSSSGSWNAITPTQPSLRRPTSGQQQGGERRSARAAANRPQPAGWAMKTSAQRCVPMSRASRRRTRHSTCGSAATMPM